jgi:soluble lytic murein transglycosylase-like protein
MSQDFKNPPTSGGGVVNFLNVESVALKAKNFFMRVGIISTLLCLGVLVVLVNEESRTLAKESIIDVAGVIVKDRIGFLPAKESAVGALYLEPEKLTKQELSIAQNITKKSSISIESAAWFVREAHVVGKEQSVDPTLILAVASVESNFNPYVATAVGAKGLMQVMTNIHKERFEQYGGVEQALNPSVNMRVGTQILKDFMRSSKGNDVKALSLYNGSGQSQKYANKVLERKRYLTNI